MTEPESTTADRTEAFVKLLGQHERKLCTYILTLVPHWADAEEILQETNVVLWREFSNFELGTNFAAWAYKIAFHQVLAFRKRKSREKLTFSDEFIEAVAAETESMADSLEHRYALMQECMTQLPAQHRELIRLRYSQGAAIESLADRLDRTVAALYRLLSRIRRRLHECVSRKLVAQG